MDFSGYLHVPPIFQYGGLTILWKKHLFQIQLFKNKKNLYLMKNLFSMDFCKTDFVQSFKVRNPIFFGQFKHLSEMNCWNFGSNWTSGSPWICNWKFSKITINFEKGPKCSQEVAHLKLICLPILCLGNYQHDWTSRIVKNFINQCTLLYSTYVRMYSIEIQW
jgi:hypothetical protein